MKKGDILFVQVSGCKDISDIRNNILGKYGKNPLLLQRKKSFHCTQLTEIGILEDHINYAYELDEKTGLVRGIGTVTTVSEGTLPEIKQAGLQTGQRFCLHHARLFTPTMIQEELTSFGLDVEVHEITKDRFHLAMCRKP